MKSRITIEVDFDNGNQPILKIVNQDSEDVRDNLLRSFLQSLNHSSRWLRIEYVNEILAPGDSSKKYIWHIKPVLASEIPQEIKLMQAVTDSNPVKPY